MTFQYYPELENNKRHINFGKGKIADIKSKTEEPITLIEPILGSYLSAAGNIIDCTGGHKGNNFWYSIYYNGVSNLLCSKLVASLRFSNETPLGAHSKQLKNLRDCLHALKNNNFGIITELFGKYYNLPYIFTDMNVDEVRTNLIGLISGDVEVYECFRKIKTDVEDIVGKSGYEDIEAFGVVIGSRVVIDITNEYLYELLKNKNDFLVQMVGFNKIETMLKKTITTSNLNINETFFNYLIMDWSVQQIPRFIVDKNRRKLIKIEPSDFSLANNCGLERALKREIQLIKKLVPLNERESYFM